MTARLRAVAADRETSELECGGPARWALCGDSAAKCGPCRDRDLPMHCIAAHCRESSGVRMDTSVAEPGLSPWSEPGSSGDRWQPFTPSHQQAGKSDLPAGLALSGGTPAA